MCLSCHFQMWNVHARWIVGVNSAPSHMTDLLHAMFFPLHFFSRLSFALSPFSLSPSFSSCSHGAADKVTGRGKCFLAFDSALFYFSAHLFERLTGQSEDNEFVGEIYPPCPFLCLPPPRESLDKITHVITALRGQSFWVALIFGHKFDLIFKMKLLL